MTPRILIVMHYMYIGGAETALVGLLSALDPRRVQVDLFLHDHRGEMMQFIPKWVNVLPPVGPYTMLERPIKELVRRGYWRLAAARLVAKRKAALAYRRSGSPLPNACAFDYMSAQTTPLLPPINPAVEYDLAISFCTPHRIVQTKVRASRKVAWIHTDYTRIWVDAARELPVWQSFDHIASISSDVTRTFLQVFPTLSEKIVEIENILSPQFVRQRADLLDVRTEMGGGKLPPATLDRPLL